MMTPLCQFSDSQSNITLRLKPVAINCITT